jgi:DNA helicase II / ATP-dependent DNA helicase PcrA
MNRMQVELNCKSLPLMVSYRCGKKIVAYSNRIVPELQAHSDNPEGEVLNINMDKFYEILKEDDFVICRNTSPLLPPLFHLLAKGIKCTIKGRDISEGLKRIVLKLKANNMEEFYSNLDDWRKNEEAKAKRKNSNSLMQTTSDKYDCLITISDGCKTVKGIIDKISNIFSDDKSPITFSTFHRVKGLEAKRVYIIEPSLIPSKWATKTWELIQERNMLYVAITRAILNLYIVNGEINFSAFDDIGFTKINKE